MNDLSLRALERQLADRGDDPVFRSHYYQCLIRSGLASELSLELAAAFRDEAAMSHCGDVEWRHCLSHEELLELVKLPVQTLNFSSLRTLTDESLELLSGLPLRSLDVTRNNRITDRGLESLVSLPLKELKLGGRVVMEHRNIGHRGCVALSKLPLETLELRGSHVSDEDTAGLWAGSFKSLLIESIRIGDGTLRGLSDQPLERLRLPFSGNITDEGLGFLPAETLKELEIGISSSLTGWGLTKLQGLKLSTLALRSFWSFNFDTLKHLDLSALKRLDLRGSLREPELDFSVFSESALEHLNLISCPSLSPQQLRHFAGMPLKSVLLSGTTGLVGDSLAFLEGSELETLDLTGADVSRQSLGYLEGLPLRTLSLYGCGNTDDEVLRLLNKVHFKFLGLDNCPGITDAGLKHLESLPAGAKVSLVGCENISSEGLKALEHCYLYHDGCQSGRPPRGL